MKVPSIFAALLGVIYISLLVHSGNLKDHSKNNFEQPPPPEIISSSSLRFEEVSESMGLDLINKFWFPNSNLNPLALPLLSIYPSVSIYDLNQDGYQDILITYPWTYPRIYINHFGKHFSDKSSFYGLDLIKNPLNISRAVFFDYDNDTKVDLFISRYGCHTLLQGQGANQKFIERPELTKDFCSNANGINIFDFNRDGFMDIFLANYWPEADLSKTIPLSPNLKSTHGQLPGARNQILENMNGQQFRLTEHLSDIARAYSNNGAITDFNDDGYPDLFIANDYSYDVFLLNEEGKRFKDHTDTIIPKSKHGMNGMNADFADFRKAGQLDFYVGEITAPPYSNYTNLLWVRDGDHYNEKADKYGVGRCGWSWSGKWADFDNDGWLDLIVSNGRSRGIGATLENTQSYRHRRSMIQSTPIWLRSLDPTIDHIISPIYSLSAFERNCLFKQVGDHFYDVAENSGIGDLQEGYGLAILDLENDGRMDFLITNMPGRPLLYRNISDPVGQWVGLDLKGQKSILILGASIRVKTNKNSFRIDPYPTNGFNSQSDARVHITLEPGEKIDLIEIRWPDGKVSIHKDLEIGKYNQVAQPKI